MAPEEGAVHTAERIFHREDVKQFAALSGDTQPRHTEPDAEGRVMVQGLLTATLPTEIGSKLEVLARNIELEFQRPVYTGEAIRCTWTNRTVHRNGERFELIADIECTDSDGKTVLLATVEGVVQGAD